MTKARNRWAAAISALFVLSISPVPMALAQEQEQEQVNLYSYRQPELIEPLLNAFEEETGIKTNVLFAAKGLNERIEAEGQNSPADVILTVDIGRLEGAKQLGITQKIVQPTLNGVIPARFRDPQGHWFALTTRARVIYASRERVAAKMIDYADLADSKWRGRICTRSGQHIYSIGLIASIIAHEGEAAARQWLQAVRDNLARKPAGNDRAQVKSIFTGECDVSLGNTYYMGKMLTNKKDPEQVDWATSVRIIFPNHPGRGTHINISGMALARYAPNRDNAIKLMEFLVSDKAQKMYAEVNFEYPVKPGTPISSLVSSWGALKADTLPIADLAANRAAASRLVDETAFDDGPN